MKKSEPVTAMAIMVIHELYHLIHYNHGSEFYELLDRTMPDWIKRKHKLKMRVSLEAA